MHRRSSPLALVVLVAIAAPAFGRDLCFQTTATGITTWGLKGFSPPGRDRCKTLTGYTTVPGWVLSGTACTKADGSTMHLAITAEPIFVGASVIQLGCNVPLPPTGGTCMGSAISASGTVLPITSSTTSFMPNCTADVP